MPKQGNFKMRELTVLRNSGKRTLISATPSSMTLDLGETATREHAEIMFSVVEKLRSDLADHHFHGHIRFHDDIMTIEIDCNGEERTWTEILPNDSNEQ
jgi:hypothetical protein